MDFRPRTNTSHPRGHWRGILASLGVLVVLATMLAACGSSVTTGATKRTATTTPTNQVTYVAVGASDAFGIGTSDPDRDNWPRVLAGLMGPTIHLVNLGVPGITVQQARNTELPIALDSHPAVITVWLAVNDLAGGVTLSAYRTQLAAMLASLKSGTKAHIYVGNLPDLTLLPYFSGANTTTLRQTVQAWNNAIAQVVAASGDTLVDLFNGYRELANHPEYIASDGLHPSTLGAQRLAEIFFAVIVTHPNGTGAP